MKIKISWNEMERDMFKKKSKKHFVLNVEEHNHMVKIFNKHDLDPQHTAVYTFAIQNYVVLT